ncbi:MAG TPA: leucyl aminopeptidase [Bacteroidales bacterium]|jgi:leucyl aminopeptidase|nr:peptidase M17 [Bacteroidota bacterium]HJN06467.1 leucyl aminopeptidase [Bacteroidales bacterium]
MDILIQEARRKSVVANSVALIKTNSDLDGLGLNDIEQKFVKKERKGKNQIIEVNRFKNRTFIVYGDTKGAQNIKLESYRKAGNNTLLLLNNAKISRVVVNSINSTKEETLAFIEGLVLGNYQFLKYKTGDNKKKNSLSKIEIYSKDITTKDIEEFQIVIDAVCYARDYVNEPDSFMTAVQLSKEAQALGQSSGAKVEVFNKKKIETLKMGGLLAVNRGSVEPPTFTIIEWKPKNSINSKPYIFVGKGVVYDTGGLSLKPSNFMDTMKSDMAGAAAVAGTMYAIAKSKLPIYVVGLIPATDNRLDGNAYTPGDIVTMFDGSTVEVMNTDAEGRMILADALSYAKKYNPTLVIDIATLTGAAARAIGPQAMVGMKVKSDTEFDKLKQSGELVHERIVEFPMWDEYAEQLKSEVADRKNIGGMEAGAITAAKFLEHFTDYPYIHLDIASPSFLNKFDSYRTVGGTGVGVRLLFNFIKSKVN